MTTYAVSTAAELTQALNSAGGGDRIELAAGDYGDIRLDNFSFSSAVTITSANPNDLARFNTLSMYQSDHISIDRIKIDFTPDADTLSFESSIRVNQSAHISITNSVIEGGLAVDGLPADSDPLSVGTSGIEGYPTGRAASFLSSEDITFSGNDISIFKSGVSLAFIDGLTFSDNHIHDIRTVPLFGGAISNVVITDNHISDIVPWAPTSAGDHADFVHFWTADSQDGPNENILISGNFFEQGEKGGSVLGIYLDDNKKDIGFSNVLIENNVLHNANLQGVAVENVTGLVVRENTFLQSSGDARKAPGIVLADGTRDVIIEDNIISETSGVAIHGTSAKDLAAFNVQISGNLQVQRADPTAANYVGNLFVNALTPNGDLDDFKVIPGSLADGIGARLTHLEPNELALMIDAETGSGFTAMTVNLTPEIVMTEAVGQTLKVSQIDWDFGDGTQANGTDVSHTYDASGQYHITAKVTLEDGRIFDLEKTVEVVTPIGIDATFNSAIKDESELENAATTYGDVNLVQSNGEGAISLETSASRVKFAASDEFENNSEYTFSLNFRFDQSAQNGILAYFTGVAVISLAENSLRLLGSTDAGEKIKLDVQANGLSGGDWHNLTYVYSQQDGTATLYLDGDQVAQATGLLGAQASNVNQGLNIGSPFGNSFTGMVDDVKFLRGAADAQTVKDGLESVKPVQVETIINATAEVALEYSPPAPASETEVVVQASQQPTGYAEIGTAVSESGNATVTVTQAPVPAAADYVATTVETLVGDTSNGWAIYSDWVDWVFSEQSVSDANLGIIFRDDGVEVDSEVGGALQSAWAKEGLFLDDLAGQVDSTNGFSDADTLIFV